MIINAFFISKWTREIYALVIPQAGHGSPNILIKRQILLFKKITAIKLITAPINITTISSLFLDIIHFPDAE